MAAGEKGSPEVSKSTKSFKFADGSGDAASNCVQQPITAGVLSGKPFDCHLIDKEGNETQKIHAYDKSWGKWLIKGEKVYE